MRREYDSITNDTVLDPLMKSINEQKANFGGDSMYIELARKFDNRSYQWVVYRNSLSGGATGYFVLFNSSGKVIKSIAFSYPFLGHGVVQCGLNGIASNTTTYQHLCLMVNTGSSATSNVLRIYVCTATITSSTSGTAITYSAISLKATSTNIGNYVTCNTYAQNNGAKKMEWFSTSTRTRYCAVRVTITFSSTTTATPSLSTTVKRTESTTQSNICQHIQSNDKTYYFTTFDFTSPSTTASWTTATSASGFNRNTTILSPYVNRYINLYILPYWSWSPLRTDTTTTKYQKSMWWETIADNSGNNYLERKFLISNITTGVPTSTSESQRYYRMLDKATGSYAPSSWGIMTFDGVTIYTCNLNTKLLVKINTQIE